MSVVSCEERGFAAFKFSEAVQRGIVAAGFVERRPIQAETIPAVLAGRDVLGLAHTGTGKTAAFALPIIERLRTGPRKGIRALIVAPTRELAMQIEAEFRLLAQHTSVKTMTIFGGVSMRNQIDGLKRGPDVVVACPGRLLDLLGRRALRLDGVQTLVLDEADRMFDMGFLPDIRRIIALLPRERQNLLFAATMPAEVRSLADGLLVNPHVVALARTAPPETIAHALYPVDAGRKLDLLTHMLSDAAVTSAIIFTRTKHRAKRLANHLEQAGHNAVALQGNMSQPQRDRAMQGFRQDRFKFLVATDIAARGIDVAQVSHVINFDIPLTPEAYTHRIGRTGRAERSGQAFTLVTHEDEGTVRAIERKIGSRIPRESVSGFGEAVEKAAGGHTERAGGHADRRAQNSRQRQRGRRSGPRRSASMRSASAR